MSTEDAIGFVRPHDRIGEQVQRSALNEDGVKGIVADRKAIERMACPGRTFKIRHVFLFADPRARTLPGGWRKDLLDFMGRVEDKGSIFKDVALQLTTEKPSDRNRIIEVAMEQLASNGRVIHLVKRRQGRRKVVYPLAVEARVLGIWLNTRDYPEIPDAEAAIHKVAKSYTKERARREYGPRKKRGVQIEPAMQAKIEKVLRDFDEQAKTEMRERAKAPKPPASRRKRKPR